MINILFSRRAGHFDPSDFVIESPDNIRIWSYGEVRKSSTLNPLNKTPLEEGLFCGKIFGLPNEKSLPVDSENIGEQSLFRFGHIDLATPCINILFIKWIAAVLDIDISVVESIIDGQSFVVTRPPISSLLLGSIISETDYYAIWQNYDGDDDFVETGGVGIKFLLSRTNIFEKINSNVCAASNTEGQTSLNRLTILEYLRGSGIRPEWMLLEALPVIPPFMRPMIFAGDGKYVTSIINRRYALVINRNNRLRRMMDLKSPSIILKNEARLLQLSVNSLINSISRNLFLCEIDDDGSYL